MRHFEGQQEIYRWRTWPPFDGFVVNIQYDDQVAITEIAKMVASGKKYFRYYSMIDYQFSGTTFGGVSGAPFATFFNWIRDNVQFNGSASNKRMRVSNTVGLFSAYNFAGERRELIPWKDVTGSLMQSLAQKMVDLAFAPGGVAIECSGLFLDQSWLSGAEWMHTGTLESGHGDLKEGTPHLTPLAGSAAASLAIAATNFGTPTSTWGDHTTAYLAFMDYLKARLEIANPAAYLIPNGEHNAVNGQTLPKPWFLENAHNNPNDDPTPGGGGPRWVAAQAHWLTDKKNILNIEGFETLSTGITGFPDALALWKANGGWISFIDNGTAGGRLCREQGYMDAAMIQGGIY
jgi:hypothetical protein